MICGSYAYYNICFADSEVGEKREANSPMEKYFSANLFITSPILGKSLDYTIGIYLRILLNDKQSN